MHRAQLEGVVFLDVLAVQDRVLLGELGAARELADSPVQLRGLGLGLLLHEDRLGDSRAPGANSYDTEEDT